MIRQNTRAGSAALATTDALLDRQYFNECIAQLEAMKRQNFHALTLDLWYKEFTAMGWDNKKLYNRVRAVLYMPQIRKEITFDDFITAPPAGDHEVLADAHRLAARVIELRRKEFLALPGMVERDAAREGLLAVERIYREELDAWVEKYVTARVHSDKQLRARIQKLDLVNVEEIYAALVQDGIIKLDEVIERDGNYIRSYIRYKIADPEVRQYLGDYFKRLDAGKPMRTRGQYDKDSEGNSDE